ncbi:MAG: dihydrolipoamide acetyltransferase family protein [Oligosphaeraceae bacterium]
MAKAIVMPKAGNSVEECLLSKWRIKVGDTVAKGDIICDVETDKSAIEVEATEGGVVLALFGSEGDLIPVLQTIAVVGAAGEDASALAPSSGAPPAEPAPTAEPAAAPVASAPAAEAAPAIPEGTAPLSPRARKFVAEHPFAMPAIAGSGAGGRIIEADVQAAYRTSPRLSGAAAALAASGHPVPAAGSGVNGMVLADDIRNQPAAPTPATEPAPTAAPAPASPAEDIITEKPFPQIRRIIAKRLLDSLNTMAQYTLNAEADVTGLLDLRKRIKAHGESLGLANINIGDMVMYAVIRALQRHPELNGEYADHVVKLHSAVNMGFACDTPRGLMVPVLHGAQAMSLAEMCRKVKAMAKQAQEGHLNPDLMAGATFTVSNLGSFGITTFTPVVSAPQLAILGVGKTLLRPVRAAGGDIVYRDYLQLSLTMNHMVIDGAPGAKFLQTLKDIIENFELVCIAG